jgi:hypothetical protein
MSLIEFLLGKLPQSPNGLAEPPINGSHGESKRLPDPCERPRTLKAKIDHLGNFRRKGCYLLAEPIEPIRRIHIVLLPAWGRLGDYDGRFTAGAARVGPH